MDRDIKDRLAQLKIPFEARYDNQIRDIIKDYVTNSSPILKVCWGALFFFPIFEHYLSLYGIA